MSSGAANYISFIWLQSTELARVWVSGCARKAKFERLPRGWGRKSRRPRPDRDLPERLWCQRAQAQHLAPPERRLEALDEALLPRKVPLGWVALVRPDRCVMAEGPVNRTNQLLRQALERLGAAPI
jgi:hypothetical protein